MTSFTYRGRNAAGQSVNGTVEAADAAGVAAALQDKGITPISISSKAATGGAAKAGSAQTAAGSLASKEIIKQRVDELDVMMFSRQLYTLLKAGVPIMRALAGLQESATKVVFKELLQDLRESLDAGRELSMALARHPAIFTPFYISMVRVGEMTGQLEAVCLRLYQHMSFERFMREQVASALRYPMFVVIAMVVAIFVVNIFVIPAFAKVFAAFNAELPIMTKILLGFSSFMLNWWHLLAAVMIGAWLAFRAWTQSESGRYQWDYIKLRIPIAGKIIEKATLARFARSFALSSKSGVPIIQTFTTVALTVGNDYIARKVEGMREGVERGESVLRVAVHSGIFTPLVLQMIAVGEESGTLDDLMQEVAEMYQGEIEYELKTLAQQIEPILIVMLGIMVTILAFGIFLPIWDLGKVVVKK
jgi:MSHA biogenesis protein MshG